MVELGGILFQDISGIYPSQANKPFIFEVTLG